MARHVTLGAISYVSGNKVIHILKAGVEVELDTVQAASVAGAVSYLSQKPASQRRNNGG